MATFTIKATSIGSNAGPYTITDNLGNVLATGVTRDQILAGHDVEIGDTATSITLESTGECTTSNTVPITRTPLDFTPTITRPTDDTSCSGVTCDGSIANVGVGGIPPYQFSKDNGTTWVTNSTFTGLCSGTYSIKIKDSVGTIVTKSVIIPAAFYSITPASTSVNEGDCLTFNISTVGVAAGTVLSVSYVSTSPGFDPATDLTQPLVTQITVNGTGSESICVKADQTLEGEEKFKVVISNCGNEKANSGDVIINDTSTSAPFNTVIGQSAAGALNIPDAATLAAKLGIAESDISFFEIDATTHDIRAKINVDYSIPSFSFTSNPFMGTPGPTKYIDIDGKVLTIKSSAFRSFSPNQNLLTEISFPKATEIESDAFKFCTSLVNVSFPELLIIGNNSFESCTALTTISFPKVTDIGSITDFLTGAFARCSSLVNVNLPKLINLGASTFSDCTALTTISLPECVTVADYAFGDAMTFVSCTALTSVSLPVATSIGQGSFRNCTALTSVSLPVVTSVNNEAFRGCTALPSISLPLATTINESVFNNCTALTSVSFPVATTIGNSTFESCTALTTISLPSVTSLGSTTGDDNVFILITGNTITLTIPAATASDGDVTTLQSNNTVTIVNP